MDTPPSARPILVALSSEAQSLRLIHAGCRLARDRSAPWVGVYVDTEGGRGTERLGSCWPANPKYSFFVCTSKATSLRVSLAG